MSRTLSPFLLALTSLSLAACAAPPPEETVGTELLYVWTGDADEKDPDFLAVVDVKPGSPSYGEILRTVPVEGRANWPHHTEYELTSKTLLANGWNSGKTFVFDLSRPDSPFVKTVLGAVTGYAYPHSYARLPNGNLLTTFQSTDSNYAPPGGLVEMTESGAVIRSASGATTDIATPDTWPYSLLVLPDLDRVVVTHTRMGLVSEWLGRKVAPGDSHSHVGKDSKSPYVQVWRLSDLKLLGTLQLPPQDGGHHEYAAEPRRLANGQVYVNTFSCGIYRIVGVGSETPSIESVVSSRFDNPGYCAVPVVLGNFWIQPSATEQAIVAYDLSESSKPREVSRLAMTAPFLAPHWIALDATRSRIVVTADAPAGWVMLINVDPATGRLSVDEAFCDAGAARAGVTFDRANWPHGATGNAMPHGAVFSATRRN